MNDSIIAENPVPVKPLTIAQLCERDSETLYALGLTDLHIAALDAAHWAACLAYISDTFDRQQLTGAIARATDRAAGVTLADVAAVLGYMPAEGQG